jgi:2'-5' RNA ligase
MILLPSEEVSEEINNRLVKALGPEKRLSLPHITLGKPFHSSKKYIDTEITSYLRQEEPFRFNLDKIGIFDYSRIIYLTDSNSSNCDRLKNLFYGIKNITSGKFEENIGFLPHLTLIERKIKQSEIKETVAALEDNFQETIVFGIDRVKVSQSINYGRWKDLGFFDLEGEEDMFLKEMLLGTS